ncbi:endonuclease/exonuclease/phosphatase family protein [Candidatus Peregrinibacteria bacterium]|nr:endonuclease/exonuclease/phosphatase family protein [Candidatus Peregrinibacteria bacterium]MBT4632041.1 endonuclease/exonuclease/phosphatase family protein [Candidatus Peregrinibacteria bacterium]
MSTEMRIFIYILVIVSISIQSGIYLAREDWQLELLTHFPHYYTLIGLIICAISLNKKMWKTAAIMLLLASINFATISPYFFNTKLVEEHDESIEILSSNFYYLNESYEEFSETLEEEDPDIFMIHEAEEWWEENKNIFKGKYPYQGFTEKKSINGMAIYSKIPGDFEFINFAKHTALKFETADFELIAVHPPAPVSEIFSYNRNEALAAMANYQSDKPFMFMGDFNITPWSPYFKDLIENSTLSDSRLGFGMNPTWHHDWYMPKIPIDHALVSPEIKVTNFRTGDVLNADHLPIIVEIVL